MRLGVRLPQYASDWHTLRTTAVALNRRGVDHLWVNDHLEFPGRHAECQAPQGHDGTVRNLVEAEGIAHLDHRRTRSAGHGCGADRTGRGSRRAAPATTPEIPSESTSAPPSNASAMAHPVTAIRGG